MSYYLIGIGGTGARCIEAFVHMTGAGLLETSQPVKILFVDADTSCGNLEKTRTTLGLYKKVCQLDFGDNDIFKNEISEAGLWNPVGKRNNKKMDEIFQRTTLLNKTDTKPLGLLYESLFTKQERDTDLAKGFRGHPAIGAAVMNESMDENEEPWKSLLPEINADKDPKIFLFASVFGGTGAAGFPTIARLLKKILKKDNEGNCIAKIGGALVLPYFRFPPADAENQNEMQAKVDEFMLNTKSALDYYSKNDLLGPVFTSIYMVGDNDFANVKHFSLGAKDQKNEANIVELYAALAAFDFFNKEQYERGTTPMVGRELEKKITWDDLPNVCHQDTVKHKMMVYIRFLYTYRWDVLDFFRRVVEDAKYEKHVTWYKKLVKKAGGIDVTHDSAMMEKFQNLGDYAEQFFSWMNDIIHNSPRKIELVNPEVCGPCEYDEEGKKSTGLLASFFGSKQEAERAFKLDLYKVVYPFVKKKQPLNGREVFQQLANATPNKNLTGSAVLMDAILKICQGEGK